MLFLACLLAAASPADAPARALVLTVLDRHVALGDGEGAQAIAKALQFRPGIHLYSREEEFAQWGAEGPKKARQECGSDRSCLARHVRAANAGLAVLLTIDREADLLSVRLLDAEDERIVGTESGPVPAAGVADAITELAHRLFEKAGFLRIGRLIIRVDPVGAIVTVDGTQPPTADPHVADVAPGSHAIDIEKEGFIAQQRSASVAAGEQREIVVTLEPGRALLERPLFWAAIGGVVATAVVLGVVAATTGGESCACLTIDGVPCPDRCVP